MILKLIYGRRVDVNLMNKTALNLYAVTVAIKDCLYRNKS